jgi:hypothetical protein
MMAAPFDLDRLNAEERALWDEFFAEPSKDGDVVRVMGFAQACSLELSGPPEVLGEYLAENREQGDLIHEYVANRKAGRAKAEPGEQEHRRALFLLAALADAGIPISINYPHADD